jgi:hypothetical protein
VEAVVGGLKHGIEVSRAVVVVRGSNSRRNREWTPTTGWWGRVVGCARLSSRDTRHSYNGWWIWYGIQVNQQKDEAEAEGGWRK